MHFFVLGELTGLEPDNARRLATELIDVGLAEDMRYDHLRLDPGLPPYLLGEMTAAEADATRSRWAEAMAHLTRYLYDEQSKNTQLAAQLTLLELPNLLAMLERLPDRWPPEPVLHLADMVERLVSALGRPQALALATRLRQHATQKLGGWNHAQCLTQRANMDRLLERGDLQTALDAAQRLLKRCLAAGETAYPAAAYDIAMAHSYLGRALSWGGAAEAALQPLAEAQRRFHELASAGDADAERMASAAITKSGDCLRDLGRLDEAALAYEEAIKRDEARGRMRDVAVGKGQLGTVRMLQGRYREALDSFAEARNTFQTLGEPGSVATAWHQIGRVHEEAGQFEPAEHAYRQSLRIKVQENDFAGQAPSLGQLGNLYDSMGRLEEAVTFHRQAAEVYLRLQDAAKEGTVRNNLARTLIKLNRYDEARQELERAIECKKPLGHAATPWNAWFILEDLERATGNTEAAQAARGQAIESYLAYRRAGGVSQRPRVKLFAFLAQAIQQNDTGEARQLLSQLASDPGLPASVKVLAAKLQSLLTGDRSPTLASDPELEYSDAAEVQLLLEQLSSR